MHTATRLAAPLIDRARVVNPTASLCSFGLYSPLNADWLRARGVRHVLGPEAEADLEALATGDTSARAPEALGVPRLAFVPPDRAGLPPLTRYAVLRMPDGSRRTMGATDATRGCKHLCRHCPIVPVYRGQFRVVPIDVVLEDVRAQVGAGAQHISFGDPDFLNGPTHARRLVEAFAAAFPAVTYDVTIKVEHILAHRQLLPVLRDTGCLFVTSAVESVDNDVLRKLRKGHTRDDVARAVALCRDAGLALAPTFVPFTPWTTWAGYGDLLATIDALELVEQVAPIQLAIRLLVTAGSALLELPEIRAGVQPFDAEALIWPWVHADPEMDVLQRQVMAVVGARPDASRGQLFDEIVSLASAPVARRHDRLGAQAVPVVSEPWYCCAEPGPEQAVL
jgi:hypothetical protein